MLHPLTGNLVIRPDVAPTQTESGLELVEHWRGENTGEIVSMSSRVDAHCPDCGGRVFLPPSVKVGDTVIFPLEAGQEIRLDGERFLLMKETDLLAVLEPHEVVNA